MLDKKDLEMISEIVIKSVEPVKEDVKEMRHTLESVQSDVRENRQAIESLQGDVGEIQTEMKSLRADVTELQMTLENETNRNIKIIAEGHLDLSRKLDDALKINNEKEIMKIRMTGLENELRLLKTELNITV